MPTLTQITDAVSRLAYPLDALVPDYAPLCAASAMRASRCSARPRTAHTSFTASAPESRSG